MTHFYVSEANWNATQLRRPNPTSARKIVIICFIRSVRLDRSTTNMYISQVKSIDSMCDGKNQMPILMKMIKFHFRPSDFIHSYIFLSPNAQRSVKLSHTCSFQRSIAFERNVIASSSKWKNRIWSQNVLFAQWSSKCDIDCGFCGSYGSKRK